MAKSPGALHAYSSLFESRLMEKRYLAVVGGIPRRTEWTCRLAIAPEPDQIGRMRVVSDEAKEVEREHSIGDASAERREPSVAKVAQTDFRVLATGKQTALIEARPVTGRTHQIRLHLAAEGHPVVNDPLYGAKLPANARRRGSMGLRAVRLAFSDPFRKRNIQIEAPADEFIRQFGFEI